MSAKLTWQLFGTCVGLVYTPLAPIVPICCTVYLWARSIIVSFPCLRDALLTAQYLNQLTFVERIAESDGAVWKIVMYRILASLSFMILLTGLSKLYTPNSTLMLAVALKTASPVLSVTAFLPLVGPAYLAHTLRAKDKPEDTIDLLDDQDEEVDSKRPLPAFKHKLLNYAWAPKLEVGPLDIKQFNVGRSRWKGLRELQSTAPEIEVDRKREARRQKRKADEKKRDFERQRKKDKQEEAERERTLRRERKGRNRNGGHERR